jgi:cytochrome oxidase Cu insertion factor (SCO1/SenC/PrrC family)
MEQSKQNGPNSGRKQLAVILIMALCSLGGSYALFFAAQDGERWGTTNNGTFVQPVVTVDQLQWQTPDGVPLSTSSQWWLWTVADQCDVVCAEALQKLRAAHILLNKEAKRVRRGITTGPAFVIPDDQPDLLRIQSLREQTPEGIYIVDPNGNLVFFYPLDINPKLLLADLKRLLKVSQIG